MDIKQQYFEKALKVIPKPDHIGMNETFASFDHKLTADESGIKAVEYQFWFTKDSSQPNGWRHFKTTIIEYK